MRLARAVALVLVVASCSSSGDSASSSEPAAIESACPAAAQQVVDRFDEFLEPFSELDPEDFLTSPELVGLSEFQNDVATTIVRVATDPNDNCTERDLEAEVADALEQYAGEGTLNQYLVGLVRQGVQVETRHVTVGPEDDLVPILATLGPGSSVTFLSGTFSLDASILVQGDLVLIGAGPTQTILESSADTAVIAVLGGGSLTMNDFTIRHVGEIPASVVVAVDASLELVNMAVSGGVVDAEGGGGSGIVLTETADPDRVRQVAIDASTISANGAAGIAVTGSFAPQVTNSAIEGNDQCGICFFDNAGGQTQSNTVQDNGVGIQVSNQAAPELAQNMFVNNQVAGLLIDGDSTPTVVENSFEGVDIVGIDVQDTAAPILQRNRISAHAVGVSLRGMSAGTMSGNTILGADVAILVGGSATPVVFDNELTDSQIAGMLHTETAMGEFTSNILNPELGAGIVVEGSATPVHHNTTINGGLVGVVFRESSGGRLSDLTLRGQQVGIETNDQASPLVETNLIVASIDAGVILGGTSSTVLRNNTFDEPLAIAIQTSGEASPSIDANMVQGGDTAILVTESSRPVILNNTLVDQNFGIGVSGSAAPIVESNDIRGATAGAMSFEGDSTGEVRDNTITDAGVVGIRIAGEAAPTIETNALFALVALPLGNGESEAGEGEAGEGDESGGSGAGMLYAEQGQGVVRDNQIFGFVIGIQVSDQATPDLIDNRVDGAGVGGVGILYGIAGGGNAEGNLSINQQLGFQLSGTTQPSLTNNTVEDAEVAAFLIQGESTALLSGNECVGGGVGVVVLENAAPELDANSCSVQ